MFLDSTVYIDIGIIFIYFITNPTFQFAAVDVTHDILSWWWFFFFSLSLKRNAFQIKMMLFFCLSGVPKRYLR